MTTAKQINNMLLVQALIAGMGIYVPSPSMREEKKPDPERQAAAEAKRNRKNEKRKLNK